MLGMSERQYAAHVGLSRGAIQKAKAAGRLVLYDDGSINPQASDARRTDTTDPAKSRPKERNIPASQSVKGHKPASAAPSAPSSVKPIPEAALGSVRDTLREQGLPNGKVSFVEARTAHEIAKAHLARLRLQEKRTTLIDRARAQAVVFRLARQERDAWVNWPARVAALMAADLGVEAHTMQKVLEAHVRAHLNELAEIRPELQ